MMSPILQVVVAASACVAGVDVRSSGGRNYSIEAKGVPLSRVLECLADKAGFKLVVDPAVGLQRSITTSLQNQTSAGSINKLLDGVPVNVALSSDPEGGRILMLLITARSETRSSGAASSGSSPSMAGTSGTNFGPGNRTTSPVPTSSTPQESTTDALRLNPMHGGMPGFTPPDTSSLYPEPFPLSPLTLRGVSQARMATTEPTSTRKTGRKQTGS